jgi:hypothetical protein
LLLESITAADQEIIGSEGTTPGIVDEASSTTLMHETGLGADGTGERLGKPSPDVL